MLGACEARVPGGRTGPPWDPSLATKALHNLRPRCWSARGCLPSALHWGEGGVSPPLGLRAGSHGAWGTLWPTSTAPSTWWEEGTESRV